MSTESKKSKPPTEECIHCGAYVAKGSMHTHAESEECLAKRGLDPGPPSGLAGYCQECGLLAYYGAEEKKPLHCSMHKKPGEYNIQTKKCEFPGCRKQSSFGLEQKKPIHCSKHRLPDEENVVNERCDY